MVPVAPNNEPEDYLDRFLLPEKLTRLEIIDYTKDGRTVIVSPEDGKKVTYSIQDNGRTLKVFVDQA